MIQLRRGARRKKWISWPNRGNKWKHFTEFLGFFEKHINYDLEHLCRNFEQYHLHPKHNFTNVKKGKIQESYWLPKITSLHLNRGCCLHIFRALLEETVLLHFLLIFPMPEVNLLTRLIDKKEDFFKNKCFGFQFNSKSLAE